jgi:hypothetical protein
VWSDFPHRWIKHCRGVATHWITKSSCSHNQLGARFLKCYCRLSRDSTSVVSRCWVSSRPSRIRLSSSRALRFLCTRTLCRRLIMIILSIRANLSCTIIRSQADKFKQSSVRQRSQLWTRSQRVDSFLRIIHIMPCKNSHKKTMLMIIKAQKQKLGHTPLNHS